MKNKLNLIVYALAFISGFLPLLSLILYVCGYSVLLISYPFFALSVTVAFVFSAYHISQKKNAEASKPARITAAFLPLIALINWAVYVFKSKHTVVAVSLGICVICAAVITEKLLKSNGAKITSVITSSFIAFTGFLLALALVFSSKFSAKTVVNVVPSPNKTYYAEVVDVDQGALGGETVVYVYKSKNTDLFFLCITKTPQRVYMGDWGEYKTMQTEWKNDNCLLIDSNEYTVDI